MRGSLSNSFPHHLVCPTFSRAPNEFIASVPLPWPLDATSQLFGLLQSYGGGGGGGCGRPSVPNDLSDAQVHLGMRGS